MAKLFSAREIATTSMEMVGVIAPQDTSAPEGKVVKALKYLDLILSEKTGTHRLWSLVPNDATFTYTANAASVDITSLLGENTLGLFWRAYNDDTDDEYPLLSRIDFESIKSNGMIPTTASRVMYIGRNQNTDGSETYEAFLRPAPTEDTTIRILGQLFSPTVAQATKSSAQSPHGLDAAFQRWMTNQLAFDIGNGPLARLPLDRLEIYQGVADTSWALLGSYRGGGQRSQGRFTKAWNG